MPEPLIIPTSMLGHSETELMRFPASRQLFVLAMYSPLPIFIRWRQLPEVVDVTPGCREITFNDSNHSIIEAIAQALCIFDDSASIATIGGAPGAVRFFLNKIM